jgi:hypothetical protein
MAWPPSLTVIFCAMKVSSFAAAVEGFFQIGKIMVFGNRRYSSGLLRRPVRSADHCTEKLFIWNVAEPFLT